MNFVDIFKAFISGLVEGLTEFLPVSSTAHLLLFSWLADFNAVANYLFEIVIQLGAIIAVLIIYRKQFLGIIFELHIKKNQKLILNLVLSFLPAAILGLIFHDFIKKMLFSTLVVALALIIGGIIMIIVDLKERKREIVNIDDIKWQKSLLIGFFQALAMIPGISRSGATIIGGIILKLDRKTAAEFSFLLAVPTIFAASFYDIYKNYSTIDFTNFTLILVGFVTAFISAIIVIKWFISYVGKHNFMPFAIYRITLGILILLITT